MVQAELELKASSHDVAEARAAFLPSFNISASAGFNAYNSGMLFNPASVAFNFLGHMMQPVFARGAIRANYDLLEAEHKGVFIQYGKTVMNAVYEVSSAIASMKI